MRSTVSRAGFAEDDFVTSWVLLFAGVMLVGKMDLNFLYQSIELSVDNFLVPLYTLLVALYISCLTFADQLEPLFVHLRRVVSSILVKTPVPVIEPVFIPAGLEQEEQPINMTGAFKLTENHNYEDFLRVQGVPRTFLSMANKARPIHRITHRGSVLTIKIESVIESQTTYIINGPPVQCDVRGRIFEDTMQYLENGKGILVKKRAITENYDVIVQRELSEDGQEITMKSRATFKDGRDPIECLQKFVRIE